MAIFSALFLFFRSLFVSRISLATEILVLRQQLLVLNRTVMRPKLRRRDRLFWVLLSRLWRDWREALKTDFYYGQEVSFRASGEAMASRTELGSRSSNLRNREARLRLRRSLCLRR